MAEKANRRGRGGAPGLLTGIGVLLLLSTGARALTEEKKAAGSDVTLVPQYSGVPSEINWKLGDNKVVDMELRPEFYMKFYRFEERATISRTNGSLTIRNLSIGDTGTYRAEVLVDNLYQYTDITLTVLECPAKPTITNHTTDQKMVFTCDCPTPGVTYYWRNKTNISPGQTYTLHLPTTEDVTLTCVVDNQVCNNSATIVIPYTGSGQGGAIAAGILIPLLIVLLVVAAYFLYKKKPVHPKKQGEERQPLTDGRSSFSITLYLLSKKPVEYYKIQKKNMPLLEVSQPPGTGAPLLLSVHVKPEDYEGYSAKADGEHCESHTRENGRVTFQVPNEVTTVALNKGGGTLCQWTRRGLRFQDGNITLDPGSVTITGLREADSGTYTVHADSIPHTFRLEVLNEPRTLSIKCFSSIGVQEGAPIAKVTLHPKNKMEGATWKKDKKPLDVECGQMTLTNGDLTICHVTAADGTYTMHNANGTLEEEFILHLQGWKKM